MDKLMCSEEMIPETPEGGFAGPENHAEIAARRQLSCEMNRFVESTKTATQDPTILNDRRVLQGMFAMEEQLQGNLPPNYIKTAETAAYRFQLVSWLFEVCEEEQFMECVFLRCVSYIDRVLSVHSVTTNHLQLLGTTCLLLSLKYAGENYNLDKLLYYTENSVSKDLIPEWEMMVVYALKWDLAKIVPCDFIQHFLPLIEKEWWNENTLAQVRTFSAFCYTDQSFLTLTPSIIAAAGLCLAIGNRVSPNEHWKVVERLHQITGIEMDRIRNVVERIQRSMEQALASEKIVVVSNDVGIENLQISNSNMSHYDEEMNGGRLEESETTAESQTQPVQISPATSGSTSDTCDAWECYGKLQFYPL